MNRCLLITCLLLAAGSPSLAQITPESMYVARYVDFMASRMLRSVQVQAAKEGISLPNAEKMAREWARLASACQLAAFTHYPPKYRDIAFDVVVRGGSIPDSNSRIEEEMLVDMQSDPSIEENLKERIERVAAEAPVCVVEAGRKAGFK